MENQGERIMLMIIAFHLTVRARGGGDTPEKRCLNPLQEFSVPQVNSVHWWLDITKYHKKKN